MCRLNTESFKHSQALLKILNVFFPPRARTPLVVTDSSGRSSAIRLEYHQLLKDQLILCVGAMSSIAYPSDHLRVSGVPGLHPRHDSEPDNQETPRSILQS